MEPVKIALVGAGSRSFGPATVRDVLLSDVLAERGVDLRLMDIVPEHLTEIEAYARRIADRLGRRASIQSTTSLHAALDGADFVVAAIEVNRYMLWAQDFHIPRKYGFKQVYGENGGPGGLFHALRNMGPTVAIAQAMERLCPGAPLLNFTNPEHKLCEAVCRLTSVNAIGLCHGVFMGLEQVARILGMPIERIEGRACGINHFTWFQALRDRETGEDLYPRLRAMEREGHELCDWHEIGLGRILFRRFGLWPSPAANHYGEYVRWADEFVASQVQYYYDPMNGHPWQTGVVPDFVYSLSADVTQRPWRQQARPPESEHPAPQDDAPLRPSGELAVPIMEAMTSGSPRFLDAVNVPNRGAIPNLPAEMVVEVPATADAEGVRPEQMEPLPEGIVGLLAVQASIQKLLVEAYAERSKEKLLQAILLDPTVDSYRQAVGMMDEMLQLQRDYLPPFE